MKKFSFELETVLSVKEKLEGQAKVDFGLAMAKLHEEERIRDEFAARKEEYENKLSGLLVGNIQLQDIAAAQSAVDIISDKLKSSEMAVKRAEHKVELARTRLNTVMTERKSISMLKDKRFNEYLEELQAEERKEIDELVSYRHSVGNGD